MTILDQTVHHHRHQFRDIALAAIGMLVCAILLLWAWNTLAADLLGLRTAQFKHGIAAVAGIASITATVRGVRRLIG